MIASIFFFSSYFLDSHKQGAMCGVQNDFLLLGMSRSAWAKCSQPKWSVDRTESLAMWILSRLSNNGIQKPQRFCSHYAFVSGALTTSLQKVPNGKVILRDEFISIFISNSLCAFRLHIHFQYDIYSQLLLFFFLLISTDSNLIRSEIFRLPISART